MTINFDAVNQNRERAIRKEEQERIQGEVRYAKQIQEQTGCTWSEAIIAAYAHSNAD